MTGNYPIRDRSGMCLDPIWDDCNGAKSTVCASSTPFIVPWAEHYITRTGTGTDHGSISRVDAQTKDELVLLCGVAESMSGN